MTSAHFHVSEKLPVRACQLGLHLSHPILLNLPHPSCCEILPTLILRNMDHILEDEDDEDEDDEVMVIEPESRKEFNNFVNTVTLGNRLCHLLSRNKVATHS